MEKRLTDVTASDTIWISDNSAPWTAVCDDDELGHSGDSCWFGFRCKLQLTAISTGSCAYRRSWIVGVVPQRESCQEKIIRSLPLLILNVR